MSDGGVVGKTFGRLYVEKYTEESVSRVVCKCECGNTVIKMASTVGRSTWSCGCLRKDIIVARNKARSTSRVVSPLEYSSWSAMKQRCLNKADKDYPRYGGRGITIHPQWIESFEAFLLSVGPRPSKAHSIERLDVNGNYTPDNCVWATPKEQANNRRSSHVIELNGAKKTITQWAELLATTEDVLRRRIYSLRWPVQKALTTPVRKRAKE